MWDFRSISENVQTVSWLYYDDDDDDYHKLQWPLKEWNQRVYLVEQVSLYYNTNVVEFNTTAKQMYININVNFDTTVYLGLLPQPGPFWELKGPVYERFN